MSAAQLPSRVAEVVHAILEASTQRENLPLTTREVMEYDGEAVFLHQTRDALNRALRLRLVDRAGRYWLPTSAAWDMRRALEDRVLAEEAG